MLINNQPITNELYITVKRYNEIKKEFGVPKKGDILITAVGTLGNVYLIPNERRFIKLPNDQSKKYSNTYKSPNHISPKFTDPYA